MQRSRLRPLMAAIAALCVVGAGALAVHEVRGNGETSDSLPAVGHVNRNMEVLSPFPSWHSANGRKYRLEMTSNVSAEGQTVLDFRLSGDWLVAALDVTPAATLLRGELQAARFTNKAAASSGGLAVEDLERGFKLQHFVELGERGAVTGVSLPDRMPSFVQSVMRALIASTQFVAPDEPARAWSKEETDSVGQYRARYEMGGPSGWVKRKLGYTKLLGGPTPYGATVATVEVLESNCEFQVSKLGVIRELRFSEHTLTKSQGPLPPMDAVTVISLTLQSSVDVSSRVAQWTASAGQATWSDAWSGPSDAASKTDTDIARIGGRTLPDLITALGQVTKDDPRATQKRARLYSGVAALLRQDANAVRQALSRIRGGDSQASLLVDALGDGGSPEAQLALCELAADSGTPDELRRGALVALGFLKKPTEKTLTSLAGLVDHDDYGTQARYSIGAAVYQLQRTDPERAAQVLDELAAPLRDPALSESEIAVQLVALGNAGHAGAMQDIIPHLDAPSATVREAALRAMRRISGPGPDVYVAEAMLRDPVAGVRATAARVALHRTPSWTLVEATRTALLQDPNETVRAAALKVAVRWSRESGTLLEVLASVARNERNQSFRTLAAQALERAERGGYGS